MLRDLIAALGASENRFVLTTRYTARAQRLLRDAPARFEILPVTPLSAAEVRATLPPSMDGRPSDDEDHARDDLARLVHALSDGRPAYARMIAEAAAALGPRGAADPVSALCALLAPGAPLAVACRYCYELRCIAPRYARSRRFSKCWRAGAAHPHRYRAETAPHPGSTKDYLSWLETSI